MLDKPQQVLDEGYKTYLRIPDGLGRLTLGDTITEVEIVADAIAKKPERTCDDYAALEVGARVLGVSIELARISTDTVEHTNDPTQETEQFIEIFERGIDAFYPEGTTYEQRMRLFDLARKGNQKAGPSIPAATVHAARADFIEALVGVRYDSPRTYRGANIANILQNAAWMRQDVATDDHAPKQATTDPSIVLRLNPPLMFMATERLTQATEGLAGATGISQKTLLERASRAVYKYSQDPDTVATQIAGLKEMGIAHHLLARPDILNYPLPVIRRLETQYQAMGIPLDTIRGNAKFYVYKPERLRGRITAFEQELHGFGQYISAEQAAIMLEEFKSKSRIVVDCGERKIHSTADLIRTYATPAHWQEALTSMRHNDDRPPEAAVLFYLARVSYATLKAVMEADPSQNIFLAARQIKNAQSHAGQRATRGRRKALQQ